MLYDGIAMATVVGSWLRGRGGKLTVVAAVLLMLGAGFCLFDRSHDGMGAHADLCLAMLAAVFAPPFLAGLVANGELQIDPIRSFLSVSRHVLDPPPKSLFLS